jgi:hypothetical protein
MKRLAYTAVTVALLSSACTDTQPLRPTGGPAALIMDAAHNGADRDFFFLPPLAPSPVLDPHFDKGAFNGHLSPTLTICLLKADLSGCETTILSPVNVPVVPSAELYQFLWDTRASNLVVGRTYRLIVKLGQRELGVLDVQPQDKGVKNARTDDFFQFQDDRIVPVNFRIEFHGQTCAAGTDCGDGRITNDGGVVTTSTGFAGALFPDQWLPAGALKAGITSVTVHIERLAVNNDAPGTSCLRSGLIELEGCYRFRTDPDLNPFGLFSEFVTAGICFEEPEEEGTDAPFQMHRREEVDGTPTGETVALESAAADFLTCNSFARTPPPEPEIGLGPRRWLEWARAGLHAVAHGVGRLVQPRMLHAVDQGAGGSTKAFSRFGWARAASMVKVASTDEQTATVGEKVANDPTVCLTLHHPTPHDEGGFPPLVNEPVTFAVTSGGGNLGEGGSSTVVPTGVNGCVSVEWFLGPNPGANTLTATAATTGSPQTFTATGVPLVGTPALLLPLNGAHIVQNDPDVDCSPDANRGRGYQIVFDWTDVTARDGVAGYELFATKQGAPLPLIDNEFVEGSQFTFVACNGFVTDEDLQGWEWRVRARDSEGRVGDYSPTRTFEFDPCRVAEGVACTAPAPPAPGD